MLKKLIKRFMPDPQKIKTQKSLKIFGNLLHSPNLWLLNRRSASGAFAVGLFTAFIPLPSQMIISAAIAMLLRVNLPLSIALVWLTNPITMPIIFYCAYILGAWILNSPEHEFYFELSWSFIADHMAYIAPPFLLGCSICGVTLSLLGYFGVNYLWRYSVMRSWKIRKTKFKSQTQV